MNDFENFSILCVEIAFAKKDEQVKIRVES